MPPTNTTCLTATELGTLPASITQDVHDAGTTYEVFHKLTAPAACPSLPEGRYAGLIQTRLTPSCGRLRPADF